MLACSGEQPGPESSHPSITPVGASSEAVRGTSLLLLRFIRMTGRPAASLMLQRALGVACMHTQMMHTQPKRQHAWVPIVGHSMCIVQPVFPHHAKYDSISPKGQEVLHMRAVEGSHLSHTEILPLRHQPLHAGQYDNLCSVFGDGTQRAWA